MTARPIGRNDPCPCGSGKKYKRCCLAKDQERELAMRPVIPLVPPTDEEAWAGDSDVEDERPAHHPARGADPRNIPSMLKALARTAPSRDRAIYRELLADLAPLVEYSEREPEVEAASKALEPHWPAFDKLYADREAFTERARLLFTEKRFAPLRFTEADVQRAFDKLGKPSDWKGPNEFEQKILAAILFVADKDRRAQLSLRLSLHLPGLLAEGRPLDACLVEECACLTGEDFKHSNAFLFHMFAAGYEAWMAAQRRRDLAWLRDLGLDPDELEGKSAAEIDAWLRQPAEDPVLAARLEQYLQNHPRLRAEMIAQTDNAERGSVQLLDRPEAGPLLIQDAELEPWLPEFDRIFAPWNDRMERLSEAERDQARQTVVTETLWPLLTRMSQAIFMPDRRRQLHDRLQALRLGYLDEGDLGGVSLAQGALSLLDRPNDEGWTYFLNSICWKSFRQLASRPAVSDAS